MTKRAFTATILAAAILGITAVGAQSTLGSLFERYDVKASFAGLAGAGWGAKTNNARLFRAGR